MGIIKDIKDICTFFRLRRTYRREFLKRDSKMNLYNIKSNTVGNILYVQINCDKSDYINASYNEEEMLFKKMRPITEYLSDELDFGDYLIPQVSNFVDENNNQTFSYGVVFIYVGRAFTLTKLLVYSILSILLAIGGTITACHFLI